MSKERLRGSGSYSRFWTPKRVEILCNILKKYERITDAVDEISREFNHTTTANAVRMTLRDNAIKSSSVLLSKVNRNNNSIFWNESTVLTMLDCFLQAQTIKEALTNATDAMNVVITYEMVRGALRRNCLSESVKNLVGKGAKNVIKEYKAAQKKVKMMEKRAKTKKVKDNKVKNDPKSRKSTQHLTQVDEGMNLEEKIIEYVLKYSKGQKRNAKGKRIPLTLTLLCNTFDCSPYRLESALVRAKAEGYRLNISNDKVKIDTNVIDSSVIIGERPKINIPKLSNNTIRFAVISDTHFGSAHCMKDEIVDFVEMAYDEFNVRTILHAGDMLAGNNVYRGQTLELEAWACKDQCQICADVLPKHDDLQYVYILGNHDVDFMKSNGTDPSELIKIRRPDTTCIGNIAARLILDPYGIDIELSHIKSSAHARSWSLEKHLQRTISKNNSPDILFCGHKHTNGYFMPQNVHSCLVPCFETMNIYATYGDFYPTIGGIIVTLTLDTQGKITRFTPMFHNYPIEFQTPVNSSEIL